MNPIQELTRSISSAESDIHGGKVMIPVEVAKMIVAGMNSDQSGLKAMFDAVPAVGGNPAPSNRLRGIENAARAYVASVNGEPEKDCWDTEDGKEAPGAQRFASDWSWEAYDDKKQKAFDDLRAALAASEGATDA